MLYSCALLCPDSSSLDGKAKNLRDRDWGKRWSMCKYQYAHFCAICNEGLSFLNPLQNVHFCLLACCSPEVVDIQSDCPKFWAMGEGWIHSYAEHDFRYLQDTAVESKLFSTILCHVFLGRGDSTMAKIAFLLLLSWQWLLRNLTTFCFLGKAVMYSL